MQPLSAKTGFAPHGSYKLAWRGSTLIVTYIDSFNEEGVDVLGEDIARQLHERVPGPWAMLADARQWDGATPAAFEHWMRHFHSWVDQGLFALAEVYSEKMQELLGIKLRSQVDGVIPRYHGETYEACYVWLKARGADVGDEQGLNAG